jgi:hypothetical protein
MVFLSVPNDCNNIMAGNLSWKLWSRLSNGSRRLRRKNKFWFGERRNAALSVICGGIMVATCYCWACYCRELYVWCLATWLSAAECYNMLLLTLLWGFVETSVIITEMIYNGTSIYFGVVQLLDYSYTAECYKFDFFLMRYWDVMNVTTGMSAVF